MTVKAGIIGLGKFSGIILQALESVRNVQVVAAVDIRPDLRQRAMQVFNIPEIYETADSLLSHKDVELVIIATPPFLHAEMGRRAMELGKHVFFEKPGSISVGQLEELIQLSKKNGVIASIDFVMRRNPLYFILKKICESEVFGLPERVFLENYAHDDSLPQDHWFWDYEKSGGIWVEHGVHFFDLSWWLLGSPLKAQAFKMERNKIGLTDRVFGWAVHNNNILAGYYHGFTKPEVFEKTALYAVFERAYVQSKGWIPTELKLDALMTSDAGKYIVGG
jgi:predicted dehydrogenase